MIMQHYGIYFFLGGLIAIYIIKNFLLPTNNDQNDRESD